MVKAGIFDQEYKKLNQAQKEAVDTIDGPVMVVAGPGTGKTQILALRIGNILKKTDTKGDSILCLTFTNSAVSAMRERLIRYIGETGEEVNIFTFHGFGMKIIEEHFPVLGLKLAPKLLEDIDTAILFDEILNENEWQYLRPRADSSRYFSDLKSLISLLKRSRITAKDFAAAITKEIKLLKNNEDNISSRGESKGQLKKETVKEIEGLTKTEEIVTFINLYEAAKSERNVLDYDDVLELLLKVVETSKDALFEIRERYLYILVDEHQDSSLVQNEFLTKVWAPLEKPDIFVVGDDRQLIYGFSGASIEHFKNFKKTFPKAKLITLVDNYRSTQVILDAAHALLQSVMSDKKLVSQTNEHQPIHIVEAETNEEEIFAAGTDIQEKMDRGLNANNCAILVPKNRQVRAALEILYNMGLPVSSLEALNFFDQEEAQAFILVLKILIGDHVAFALSFFNKYSQIEALEAFSFLANQNMREFSFETLRAGVPTLFGNKNQVDAWIHKLMKWQKDAKVNSLESLIATIGSELLGDDKEKKLITSQEIIDTILSLLNPELAKNPNLTLSQFVSYLGKLESAEVSLVVTEKEGVRVLTMHSSKGLEFEYVWIAHMDERSLVSGKKIGFTLPESIREVVEERDIDAVKRKLYVAITRAKRFCTLSYSLGGEGGHEQEIAKIIASLPPEIFSRRREGSGSRLQTSGEKKETKSSVLKELAKLVADKYTDRYVSASLLNNFFECPWKWYFLNLLGLPQPKMETLEFGGIVHASVDRILSAQGGPAPGGNMIPTRDDIEKIVTEEVSGPNFSDERTRLRMSKEVLKIILAWVNKRLPEIKPIHKTEESISMKDLHLPHLQVYGRIDLIENLNAKEVRVTDFKTGSVRRKSEIEKLDDEGRPSTLMRQLAMYSYLLENNLKWKGVRVRESQLEFLEAKEEKDRVYSRVLNQSDINLLVKDIKDYDDLLKSGEWVNRPCNYNSYGKNTECEYCKLAEIYK